MTQPQSEIQTPYAPLPVRARGTLEIFDTSFKLFRRYAGVLLAWSLVSGIINIIPGIGWFLYLFTMPFIYGAVSCAIAAAVRGQKVSFKQIWGFTKPRYGALLGVLILACILLSVVMFGVTLGGSLLTLGLVALASNYGIAMTVIAWIVGTIVGLVAGSLLLGVMLSWYTMAPVIACLEDSNRGSGALSRVWTLLSGNWRKCCGVATIVTLMGSAAFFILGGFAVFIMYGGWNNFIGLDSPDVLLSSFGFLGFYALFLIAWMPIQTVVGGVFYLDLRTRKEALDLEWTNYAAKPEGAPETAPNAPSYAPAPPSFPAGGPPYAPGSSMSASGPGAVAPQPPVFAPQTPVQQPVEQSTYTPTVPVAADSFADFAAQVETPQNAPSTPSPLDLYKQAVAAEAAIPPTPPVVVQPPAPSAPLSVETAPSPASVPIPENGVPVAPVPVTEVATSPAISARLPVTSATVAPVSTTEQSAPAVTEAPPVPAVEVEPTPVAPPAPPVSEPTAAPIETSSFAPPPRFRRKATEDDDYPSSFGGSTR